MTPEHRSALQERLARNPGIILETLAEAGEATPAELIECLPAGCWHKMAGERMTDVLQLVAGWGEVTTIMVEAPTNNAKLRSTMEIEVPTAALTWVEPGTQIALTPRATSRPLRIAAARRRSDRRLLVQLPMKAASIGSPSSGMSAARSI